MRPQVLPSSRPRMVRLRATVLTVAVARSMIVGSSFSDFVFRSLWQNSDHRSRIRTFSRNGVPSSSLMNCLLLALVPFNPTIFIRCLQKPLWSLFPRSRSVSARCASSKYACMESCGNQLLQVRTRRSQSLPRGSIPGARGWGTQEMPRILPRCPCWCECGQGFGSLIPSMSAAAM